MKMALPENAKIAKEAKECMQECVSEFISFITSEGAPLPPPKLAANHGANRPSQPRKSASRRSARRSMARTFCSP